MLLAESQIKPALAICLSICFGWSFFACVWLCSHDSQHGFENRSMQTQKCMISDGCESCSIEDARVVVRQKPSTIDPPGHAVERPFLLDFQRDGNWFQTASLSHLPLSTADPPLERLCAYRI